MSRFHNAIYLGDIQERIRILAEIGQLPLAYMMAVTHNVTTMAEPLKKSVTENLQNIKFDFKTSALVPPKPIIKDFASSPIANSNWPHH